MVRPQDLERGAWGGMVQRTGLGINPDLHTKLDVIQSLRERTWL